MNQPLLYGAIEAGGTKFNCAIARKVGDVVAEQRIDTTQPAETLQAMREFFLEQRERYGAVAAFGIGAFGPLDLNKDSPTWGQILTTPKMGWQGADLARPLQTLFKVPVLLDTDVNAAALVEATQGAGRGAQVVTYITVGTGIGGGAVMHGRALQGLMHPEMGHIHVKRHPLDRDFAGTCPFHGDCLEGLASGPAIVARWGAALSDLPPEHNAYDIIGDYLGQLAASVFLMLSSERILFGGGVMKNHQLMSHIRRSAERHLNGYLPLHITRDSLAIQIAEPAFGERAGLQGAIALAMKALSV